MADVTVSERQFRDWIRKLRDAGDSIEQKQRSERDRDRNLAEAIDEVDRTVSEMERAVRESRRRG